MSSVQLGKSAGQAVPFPQHVALLGMQGNPVHSFSPEGQVDGGGVDPSGPFAIILIFCVV